MSKFFAFYGTVVTCAFIFATSQGYVFSSLFADQQHTPKGSSSHRSYHK